MIRAMATTRCRDHQVYAWLLSCLLRHVSRSWIHKYNGTLVASCLLLKFVQHITLERRKNKWHGFLMLRGCFLYGTSQIFLGGRSINCIASTTESRLLFSGTTCKMGIQLLLEVLATLPSNCSAADACSSISMPWDPGQWRRHVQAVGSTDPTAFLKISLKTLFSYCSP